jgi:hypothetical protein
VDKRKPRRRARLRALGLIPLVASGVLSTLATGGGGGGGGGGNAPGVIQLQATSFDVAEGMIVNILVARSGGNSGAVSVEYATADGTAIAGADYTAANGTLTWPNNVSGNRTISIPIPDDGLAEPVESFTVTLSNVSGGATLGANSSATIRIIDNDVTALSAFGPITALNSATVNGIRYDTDAASVIVNGVLANVSDLELGQVVAVEGEANLSDGTGTAAVIDYSASVIGPVENLDATLKRLVVMGQTVLTNADTVFDSSIDPDTFAGLAVGTTVQISGFRNAADEIIATRIEPDPTSTGMQLIGTVTGLDLANMLFSINRLIVDYGSASLIDLPAGMPANGLLVMIRGSLTNGILVVNEIASTNPAPTPGERAQLGGIVTRFVSSEDFDLNGFPITTDASTGFVNGTVDDLQANAEITIDGEISVGGDFVLASRITFGTPVPDRTVLTFDFENFTNISVFGLSRVMVAQGPNFSVEATGNADIINDIQVTQNGDTVIFGNDKTQILDAVVTMPVLNQIDVDADALADVTLRNFDQTQMIINVDGVSRLRGEELTIGDLAATVSGVSLLDLGGIRPIGSADIAVSGVSQATLNMDVGSTLTGSVSTGQGTGASALFYYGTDVTLTVTTDALSSVVKLGETRP